MATDTSPDARPLRIFLSSTARDLPEHRKAVTAVIDRLGHAPVRMETFGAREGQSLAECRRLAAEADAMVVVVAHRYGWVPKSDDGGDGEKSITWHEVDAAVSAAKPVFRYIVDGAPISDRDDDERLELFRQFLRQYPCDTFSTPEDLATRVAVTLGEWSRDRVRDFASALKLIDCTGGTSEPQAFQSSTFFQLSLVRLVLESASIPPKELDRLVGGAHLKAARTTLAQHSHHCAEQLSALESQLADARAQAGEILALVRQIEAERPPNRPVAPQQPSQYSLGTFYSEIDRQRAQQSLYEAYLRDSRAHKQAVERHTVSLAEFGNRQAALPQHRLRLETAQRQVSQLEFNLLRLRNDCASQRRQLKVEVGIARDQDIAAMLGTMRDRGAQLAVEPRTVTQGFLLLQATGIACAFLGRYLSGSVSASLWVEQVGKDVSEVAEETVRRRHQWLGRDCLTLLGPLNEGLSHGLEVTNQIGGILDALPLEELRRLCSESEGLLATQVPKAKVDPSLIDLDAIALASSVVGSQSVELADTIRAGCGLQDAFAALHSDVQGAEQKSALWLNQLEDKAAEYRERLSDCRLAWGIVSRAEQIRGIQADTEQFCACLQAEAERRLGEPVQQLVARCESTDFGVNDAKRVRVEHVSTPFLKQTVALQRWLAQLEVEAAKFDQAAKDLAELPRRQEQAYQKQLTFLVILSIVPIITVLGALAAVPLIRRYDSAMRSNHPSYSGLRNWSLPPVGSAVGVSTVGVLACIFALLFVGSPQVGNPLIWICFLCYAVSLIAWAVAVSHLLRIRKQP